MKIINYNVLRLLSSTLSSLYSFQMISFLFIIYLKHCYVNTLKMFTMLTQFLIKKHKNASIGLYYH